MKKFYLLLISSICLSSCMSVPFDTPGGNISTLESQKLQEQKANYEQKISELEKQISDDKQTISQLTSQVDELNGNIKALKQELADSQSMLEPYKDLSAAEAKLKQAEVDKAEMETRMAMDAAQKKEAAAEQAEEEAVAKAKDEEQQKASLEAVKKERIEDAKYIKIGVRPIFINCQWSLVNDFGNQLYSPKLNLKLKNVSNKPISKSEVRVVFLDVDNKEVFDEQHSYFVSEYSDSPLAVGFSKEIIITAGKGYQNQWVPTPNLSADIYIDKQLLTSVPVTKN